MANGDKQQNQGQDVTIANMSVTTKLILGAALGIAGILTGVNTYQTSQQPSTIQVAHTKQQEEECIKEREKLETRILNHVKLVKEGIEKEDGYIKNVQEGLLRSINQAHGEIVVLRDEVNELKTSCKLGAEVDKQLLEKCEDCKQRIIEHERKRHGKTGGLEHDIYSGAIFNTLTGVPLK